MKLPVIFALLLGARAKNKPHNDNLRAGQYADRVLFSPWKVFVS